MQKILLTILTMLMLSGCSFIEKGGRGLQDRRVARIGQEVLYESDIVRLMPEGVSSADSAAMISRYINTWALGRLMLRKAEEQLSKAERDVTAEVEEFRSALLGFRFEKRWVEERLDTTVTLEEARLYYEEHPSSSIFPYPLVKARVIRISTSSPYYETVKGAYTVTSEQDVAELRELCYSSAERYTDFGGDWVPLSQLAKELGTDIETCTREVLPKKSCEMKFNDSNYLIFIEEKVDAGEVSPFEYNVARIRETILGKRKQELLTKLEQDLLEDAHINGTLKIY
ncbi:MAG: hypothetical protein GXY75_03875 [Bacteroidales bacterium]|jgi:hypothetical protein|nr:hypothetical protein [Bacteroidales bacterium]